MRKKGVIGLVIYMIFGLYFVNSGLNLITLPEFVNSIDRWIILVGGILIIIGGINYLRAGKKSYY